MQQCEKWAYCTDGLSAHEREAYGRRNRRLTEGLRAFWLAQREAQEAWERSRAYRLD